MDNAIDDQHHTSYLRSERRADYVEESSTVLSNHDSQQKHGSPIDEPNAQQHSMTRIPNDSLQYFNEPPPEDQRQNTHEQDACLDNTALTTSTITYDIDPIVHKLIFDHALSTSAFLGLINDYNVIWTQIDDTARTGTSLLESIGEKLGYNQVPGFKGASITSKFAFLQEIDNIKVDGTIDRPVLGRILPISSIVPEDFSFHHAIIEVERFGFKHFDIPPIPDANITSMRSSLSYCAAICGALGYKLPRTYSEDPASFIFSLLRSIPPAKGQVRDIGGGNLQYLIKKDLHSSLQYGTCLGKEVCYIDSPWPEGPTSTQSFGEINILKKQASKLAQQFHQLGELTILDLGAGDSQKLTLLLDELEAIQKRCRYVAVDINKRSLDGHVQRLSKRYVHVECCGFYGTFEDARIVTLNMPGKKIGISCSSTLTNFAPAKTSKILRSWVQVVDRFILGQHEPVDDKALCSSYHTPQFLTFMRSGLAVANGILGLPRFDEQSWTAPCKATSSPQCHMFYVTSSGVDASDPGFDWFACYKYTQVEFLQIIRQAGWRASECYHDHTTRMSMYDIVPA